MKVVALDLIEKLAATAPASGAASGTGKPRTEASGASGNRPSGSPGLDLPKWIVERGLKGEGPEPWKGGLRWIFPTCPWNSEHTNASAYIVQLASGAVAAGCHHDGCTRWL